MSAKNTSRRPVSVSARPFGRGSIVREGLLGLASILVDVVIYAGLVILGINHVLAAMVSSFLGIRTNYVMNVLLNFPTNMGDSQVRRFTAFVIIGLLLSAGVLQMAYLLGAGLWWSKAISLAVVVPLQFLVNRMWSAESRRAAHSL